MKRKKTRVEQKSETVERIVKGRRVGKKNR